MVRALTARCIRAVGIRRSGGEAHRRHRRGAHVDTEREDIAGKRLIRERIRRQSLPRGGRVGGLAVFAAKRDLGDIGDGETDLGRHAAIGRKPPRGPAAVEPDPDAALGIADRPVGIPRPAVERQETPAFADDAVGIDRMRVDRQTERVDEIRRPAIGRDRGAVGDGSNDSVAASVAPCSCCCGVGVIWFGAAKGPVVEVLMVLKYKIWPSTILNNKEKLYTLLVYLYH